ncbi:MAG: toll/interleukin-1 receptor domain-containing protein [Phycisphaerales bacterium]|nr:toll/interleukin-1 receptor domain-containing protein [Phycisphaerales bacterium]
MSYSVKDLRLVGFIADQIRPHAEPVFWTQNRSPGHDAWRTIFDWIDSADYVIAVITDAVVERGESVNQEIGFAKGKGKLVIVGLRPPCPDRLGCLHGITYLPLDRDRFPEAMDRLKDARRLGGLPETARRLGTSPGSLRWLSGYEQG